MKTLFFACLILLCSCGSPQSSKPIVVVTIPPYAYFVDKIAGDLVSTEIFVPAGANPHTYEATPSQVERFSKAVVWFRTGDPIEDKIIPFLKEKNVKVVDLSAGIPLIGCTGHCHGGEDRHIWLNPRLALEQCKTITEDLSLLFPEQREIFEQNYHTLSTTLENLDSEIEKELRPLQGSYLLLSHPALGYYCERYGLHQLSVEFEGKEPRPQQVAHLLQETQEHAVKVIFTEPQYSNKGAALIGEKLNLPIYQIDPYLQNYLESMHSITNAIVKYYDHSS